MTAPHKQAGDPPRAALAEASDPQTPQGRLRELVRRSEAAARPEPEVLAAIGGNPNTPLDLLLQLLPFYPDAVLANPALELLEIESPGTLATLSADTAMRLLARPEMPEHLARQILLTREIQIDRRLQLASSASTPRGVLLALASAPEMIERCEAAHNQAMPAEGVARLLDDSRPEVRAAVARGTADPTILQALAQDKHPSPRLFARSRLEKRPAERPPRLPLHAAGGASSPGHRVHNEDELAFGPLPGAYLALVSDGMGGHSTGYIAAKITTKEVSQVLDTILPFASESEESDCLATAIAAAHEGVCRLQKKRDHLGMGATVAAVLLCGDRAHIGHVGDSRVYRLRHGSLEQITRDHSLFNDYLALKPNLTAKELDELPRNVITRALGMMPTRLISDHKTLPLEPGDVFLVESDGLHRVLSEEEMRDILQQHPGDPAGAAQALVAAAEQIKEAENITVVVVDTSLSP